MIEQLPPEQQEMLVDILRGREIEARRQEIAASGQRNCLPGSIGSYRRTCYTSSTGRPKWLSSVAWLISGAAWKGATARIERLEEHPDPYWNQFPMLAENLARRLVFGRSQLPGQPDLVSSESLIDWEGLARQHAESWLTPFLFSARMSLCQVPTARECR